MVGNNINDKHAIIFIYIVLMLTTILILISWLAKENVYNETYADILLIISGILYTISMILFYNDSINCSFAVFILNSLSLLSIQIVTKMSSMTQQGISVSSTGSSTVTTRVTSLAVGSMIMTYLTILVGAMGYGLHILDPCQQISK